MSAGGGGPSVGRISIKVVPDLAEFRAKMEALLAKYGKESVHIKAMLEGAEKVKAGIKEAAKDQTAKVSVKESGATEAKEKIKAAAKDQVAKIKVIVDDKIMDRFERRIAGKSEGAVSQYEPNFNLTVEDEKLRRQVESQLAELKGLASLPVHMDPEIATRDKIFLQSEMDKLHATLQAHADRNKIKVGFEAVDQTARDQLAKGLADVRRLNQEKRDNLSRAEARVDIARIPGNSARLHDHVTVQSELDGLSLMAAHMEAKVKIAAWDLKAKAKVEPELDMGLLAKVRQGLSNAFSNIGAKRRWGKMTADDLFPDAAAAAAGAAGKAASGMAGAGVSAAGSLPSLFSFAGVLMLVAAAVAVLLPPLLAMVAGLATLAPGMLALVAPAAAVALGMDGIKKAATDAGLFEDSNGKKKGGGAVGEAIRSLKEAVSGEFASKLTAPFAQLGTIFPKIQGSMVGVAGGLSAMATGFIDSVSKGQGLKDVNDIIAKMGQGLQAAAPGIRSFTDGLLRLVDGIAQKFPGLGKWFSDLGAKFSRNMTEWTSLPTDNGLTKLENLIANVRKGIEGLTGIFQAFWNQGMSSIQDPSFGQHMLDFFNQVKAFCTTTLPALAAGFENLAAVMDTVAAPFKTIGKLWDVLGKIPGAQRIMKSLVPEADAIGLALKTQDFIGQDGPATARAAGQEVRDGFQRGLMGNGSAGIQKPKMFGGTGLNGSTTPATADGGGSGQKIMADTQTAIQGAQAAAQTAAPAIQGQFTTALVPLTTMPTTIGTAMTGTTVAVGTQMGAMSAIAGAGSQQTVGAVQANLAPLPGVVNGAFSNVGNTISTSWGSAIQTVGTGCNQILVAVASILGQLPMIVAVPFTAMTASITVQMGIAVTTVASMCSLMVSTALSFAGAMKSAGVAIGASFAEGLASTTGLVQGAASALMGAAKAFFPNSPAKEGPFSGKGWVVYSGHAIGNDFAQGLDESTGTVVDAAKSLMQQLSEAFNAGTDMSVFKGDIKQALDELELKRKELKTQSDAIPKTDKAGRAGVKTQMDQITALKDQLGLQSDKIKMEDKAAKEADKNNPWKDMPQKMSEGIQGVGQGVVQSYAQDLGISGNGAVQALANYGIGFANKMASQFVFNVSNVDEAMSIKQNQQSKDTLATVGR